MEPVDEVAKALMLAYIRQTDIYIPYPVIQICLNYYYIKQQWNMKQLMEKLSNINGLCCLSLFIPNNGNKNQLTKCVKMLCNESGLIGSIKSRKKRLSIFNAIIQARDILKQYQQIPHNGLIIYVMRSLQSSTTTPQYSKYSAHFEPFLPINSKRMYATGPKFIVDQLLALMQQQELIRNSLN